MVDDVYVDRIKITIWQNNPVSFIQSDLLDQYDIHVIDEYNKKYDQLYQ